MGLTDKRCVPCEGGVPPLTPEEIERLKQEISPEWKVIDNHHLRREFSFNNFKEVMGFVNMVAAIAEMERHHPDMIVHYSRVEIEIFTHAINGLSENDFILAAKIDQLL